MRKILSFLTVVLILIVSCSFVSAATMNTTYPWSSTTFSSAEEKYFYSVVAGTIEKDKSYGLASYKNTTGSGTCEMTFGPATTGSVSIDGNIHKFKANKTIAGGTIKSGFYRSSSGPAINFSILGSVN